MTTDTLTDRQKCIYLYIRQCCLIRRLPPSRREIAEKFGINHHAIVGHLERLERKGVIRLEPSISRGIFLTDDVSD